MNFITEATNTVNSNWFTILLAKLFGTYHIYVEDGWLITVVEFKGKSYFINKLKLEE